jgi:hypothetical protein
MRGSQLLRAKLAPAAARPPAPPSSRAPARPDTSGNAVATAVVGDGRVAAGLVLATRNMPAESRCAAALDRAHHLQLAEADVASVGITPRRPVAAEDVRDLQRWSGHGRRASSSR